MSGNIYHNGTAPIPFNEYFNRAPNALQIQPRNRYTPNDAPLVLVPLTGTICTTCGDYDLWGRTRRGGGELQPIVPAPIRQPVWNEQHPLIQLMQQSHGDLKEKIDEVKQQNDTTHRFLTANIMQNMQAMQASTKEQIEQSNAKLMGELLPAINDIKIKQQEIAEAQRRRDLYRPLYRPDYRPPYNRPQGHGRYDYY
ncbi:Protein of unknown function [Pyronema omphalodes CBS 100304]|uniref:Uncharacterized protein n=1 Tax=Pyronema omphalodes (strain CBS 100304) TaxID=1076935 RepID=U4L3B7_PYROM|nr:Protein of unknown function [Pyronema omphalodes CBS 100304]